MSRIKWSLILFILIEGIIGYAFYFHKGSFYYLIIAFFIYIATLAFFSMNLKFNFFLKAYSHSKKGYVTLGFDDGPDVNGTIQILDILDQYNAKAVFFLIGKNAAEHPDLVLEIHKRGHLIGGHTLNHRLDFGILTEKNVEHEIIDGITIVEEIIGKKVNLFRPPFGVSNPRVAKVVSQNKLKVIGWNLRSYDTRVKDATKMLSKLLRRVKSGSSILFHDRIDVTSQNLPQLLEEIKRKKLIVYPEFEA